MEPFPNTKIPNNYYLSYFGLPSYPPPSIHLQKSISKTTSSNNKENHCEIIQIDDDSPPSFLSKKTSRDSSIHIDHSHYLMKPFSISIPTTQSTNRTPGLYEDLYSSFKLKHNNLIYIQSTKLKNFSNGNGIRALILDGKSKRTTTALEKLGHLLKKLYIVEINKETFDILKRDLAGKRNIEIFHAHIGDIIKMNIDPFINVVYFDVMCSFFSSDKSEGSESIIDTFLQQSKVDEMIFAATFCLRNGMALAFGMQKKKIVSKLKILFLIYGFNVEQCIGDDEMIYKGQKANNQSMMFVLFHLRR